jgi:hypothetical protein
LISKRERVGAAFTAPRSHSVSPEADTNRLAHIFLDDRTDAEGKKVLFVQELQSDWAQEGRKKGFLNPPDPVALEAAKNKVSQTEQALRQKSEDLFNRGERVQDHPERLAVLEQVAQARGELLRLTQDSRLPPAPFITSTEDWINLSLKRVIKEAVDSGADNVAFIKGEQAANKYDLSKQVDKINVVGRTNVLTGEQTKSVALDTTRGQSLRFGINKEGIVDNVDDSSMSNFIGKGLDEVIGKDLAKKIMDGGPQTISGEGLKVGGEGMKGFYDNILPKTANKLLEKLGGGKVKTIEIEKEIPSRLQNYASSFMEWMTTRHPEVSSGDAARAWAMGMDNNEFVKEYYEATKPVKYIGFEITPEMREMVKTQGLPQFAKGGEVSTKDFIRAHA